MDTQIHQILLEFPFQNQHVYSIYVKFPISVYNIYP